MRRRCRTKTNRNMTKRRYGKPHLRFFDCLFLFRFGRFHGSFGQRADILRLDLFRKRQRQHHCHNEHACDRVVRKNIAHQLRHTGEEFRDLRDADADVVDGSRCAGLWSFIWNNLLLFDGRSRITRWQAAGPKREKCPVPAVILASESSIRVKNPLSNTNFLFDKQKISYIFVELAAFSGLGNTAVVMPRMPDCNFMRNMLR